MKDGKKIRIIEWHDMDKRKFYGYSLMLGTTIRFSVYPLNLIKTRLQVQEGKSAYKGTFDAVLKIARNEGIRGFYKGFPISLIQVAAGQLYITTYETTKQTIFHNHTIPVQHFLGGFFASCISQTIMVPVDVISQYQQMSAAQCKPDMATKVNAGTMVAKYSSTNNVRRSVLGQAFYISQYLLKSEGLQGLYRGYLLSLCTYGLNSGFYWGFYYLYSELLESFLPENKTKLQEAMRISTSGIISSATAICLTNPFDVIRTRYQLQVRKGTGRLSGWSTFRSLVNSEGYKGLTKGITARIAQSSFSSWALILGYEYVKKLSLKEDKDSITSSDGGGFEAVTAFQKS